MGDKMNENGDKKRGGVNTILLVLVLLMACIMAAGAYCIINIMGVQKEPEHVQTEYEQQVNRITEIDLEERQAAIDKIVEENQMNIHYSFTSIFNQDGSSVSFQVRNIENNHYPIRFTMFDENGNEIYQSDAIEPGFEMNAVQLDTPLPVGTHECSIKLGYVDAGNVSTTMPITIKVQ